VKEFLQKFVIYKSVLSILHQKLLIEFFKINDELFQEKKRITI